MLCYSSLHLHSRSCYQLEIGSDTGLIKKQNIRQTDYRERDKKKCILLIIFHITRVL